MANIKNAQKRIKVSAKKAEINKSVKSEVNTEIKKYKKALAAKDKKLCTTQLAHVTSLLDRAAQDNVFHKNKANRIKARLSKQYAEVFTAK